MIGEDFVEGSQYELALDTSVPLNFTTVRFDSLRTSQEERLLVGGRSGTEFGDFTTLSYFMIDLVSNEVDDEIDLEGDLIYDSITLFVPFDGYSVYLEEEIRRSTLIVEQLKEELEYPEDDGALFNFSEVPGVTTSAGIKIGEQQFFIASDRLRDQEIRLSDGLGEDLFARLLDDDEIFNDLDDSGEYLQGFRIYLEDPDFLLGIEREGVRLRLHATDVSTSTRLNIQIDFEIGFTPHFVEYRNDNVPEILQVEDVEEEVASDDFDNTTLVMGGVGFAAKVELTETRQILLPGDEFILVNAELRIHWLEQGHETGNVQLIAQFIDEDFNDLSAQRFPLQREFDDEYGRDNFYVLNATEIVEFILRQPLGDRYYLLITSQDYNSTPTPVLLGDGSLESEMKIYTIKN